LILFNLNSRHRKTLGEVFAEPANGAIEWGRIEALLVAAGCRCIEGSGSSVTFELNGVRAYFHRPHPSREALRYRVRAAREFLIRIGVEP
jgi:hypothetical protein